jgi:hypothetical protein
LKQSLIYLDININIFKKFDNKKKKFLITDIYIAAEASADAT